MSTKKAKRELKLAKDAVAHDTRDVASVQQVFDNHTRAGLSTAGYLTERLAEAKARLEKSTVRLERARAALAAAQNEQA